MRMSILLNLVKKKDGKIGRGDESWEKQVPGLMPQDDILFVTLLPIMLPF